MSVQQTRRMEEEEAEIRPSAPSMPAAPQEAVVRMLRPVEGSAEELSPQAARRLQVLRYAQLLSMLHVRGVALRRELGAVWRMGRADPARLEPNLKRLRAILGEASLDAEQFAGYCPPMRGRVDGVRSRSNGPPPPVFSTSWCAARCSAPKPSKSNAPAECC